MGLFFPVPACYPKFFLFRPSYFPCLCSSVQCPVSLSYLAQQLVASSRFNVPKLSHAGSSVRRRIASRSLLPLSIHSLVSSVTSYTLISSFSSLLVSPPPSFIPLPPILAIQCPTIITPLSLLFIPYLFFPSLLSILHTPSLFAYISFQLSLALGFSFSSIHHEICNLSAPSFLLASPRRSVSYSITRPLPSLVY